MEYWIDGIVIKLDNIEKQLSLGESNNRPKGQIAIKFEPEGKKTILRKVQIEVGHTGAINPKAIFDTIKLGGTEVSNATLCNWDNIGTLNIAIGDEITVIKAGDIIPRVVSVTNRPQNRQTIPLPKNCPSCDTPVSRKKNIDGNDTASIFCTNDKCPGKLSKKIDRYIRSLDIQEIGDSVLEATIKNLNVTDAADLYTLKNKKDQLANLLLNGKTRLGEKRAEKIITNIEATKLLTIDQLLGSIGIDGLGKRRVTLVRKAIPKEFDTIEDWYSTKLLTKAQEIGLPRMAERIHKQIQQNKPLITKLINNGIIIKNNDIVIKTAPPGGFIICITGKLSQPKSHYSDMITATGHTYTDDFSKLVTHLVAADPESGSSKLQKATKQGIKVISEKELLDLIEKTKT